MPDPTTVVDNPDAPNLLDRILGPKPDVIVPPAPIDAVPAAMPATEPAEITCPTCGTRIHPATGAVNP